VRSLRHAGCLGHDETPLRAALAVVFDHVGLGDAAEGPLGFGVLVEGFGEVGIEEGGRECSTTRLKTTTTRTRSADQRRSRHLPAARQRRHDDPVLQLMCSQLQRLEQRVGFVCGRCITKGADAFLLLRPDSRAERAPNASSAAPTDCCCIGGIAARGRAERESEGGLHLELRPDRRRGVRGL